MTEEQLELEKKEIVKRYKKLIQSARRYTDDEGVAKIRKAFELAVEAHKDMRRKSGEPYIYHPIEVAQIVVDEIGLGKTSIIVALLHDTVEDTYITLEDLEKLFGEKVSRIVDGLTKLSKNITKKAISVQAENFRKMLMTISEDPRVVLIKIADRLHNMRTLGSMPMHKRLKIKSETEFMYAPLSHRLGLYQIKSELEDLCLKYSNPKVYSSIEDKLAASTEERDAFINSFKTPIIKDVLEKMGVNADVKSRTKAISSIWGKMQKQEVPFEEVYDVFAIRIILDVPIGDEKSACWRAYSIVTDYYMPNTSRLRDWISAPRSNGYESLHTTVMKDGRWVEVQIRTKRMDEIAEKGLAAHWRYKKVQKGGKVGKVHQREQSLEDWISQVRDLLENNDGSAIEFINDFKANLFVKEVYTFTPNGDLKMLPSGATVVDFAFAVHSEVGAHCLSAKVNGKLVPLNHVLSNGDQVEIMTSKKLNVNKNWLEFVVTSRAKSKIKQLVREDQNTHVQDGKEIVERKFRQQKVDFNERNASEMASFFGFEKENEFYRMIGMQVVPHNSLKKFFDKSDVKSNQVVPKVNKNSEETKVLKKEIGKLHNGDEVLVIGEDLGVLSYSFAKCCHPIPGDDVFGFITINDGIKIHRSSCPNAVSMMAKYGYRIIRAQWANQADERFDVTLEIIGRDRPGIVNDVTQILNSMKVTIFSINFATELDIFKGKLGLSVRDNDEFEGILGSLEAVEGVVDIHRHDDEM